MDLKFSKVTRKGAITIVTLSRPDVYNALHTDAHFELNKVFDDFSADPEQWVAIVTGAGDKGTWVRILRPPVEGKLVHGSEGVDVGDKIRVKLVGVDVDRGFIDFVRTRH